MAAANKYRQQRVQQTPKKVKSTPPPKPRPSFNEGDMVILSKRFNVPTVTIHNPCKALSINESRLHFSGWSVSVEDRDGVIRKIDSGLFSPAGDAVD